MSVPRDGLTGEAILASARDLVARGWSRSADARDDSGRAVDAGSPTARRWSLLGALVAAADLPTDLSPATLRPLRAALGALAEVIEDPLLAEWNDAPSRTQEDVVDVLERARRICAERYR